jgi:TetR/AcrR family transcriptional repressor of lmrAB and yxaGH operons
VAAGALSHEPAAREAAATAFTSWERTVADGLVARGLDPERARSRAALVVSAVEGALLLARAQRSTAPLEAVARELRAILMPGLD